MADSNLSSNPTPTLDKRQAAPRRDIIAGSVSAEERSLIVGAYEQFRFKNISHGCRVVLLAFADSVQVRAAVHEWIKANPERAA